MKLTFCVSVSAGVSVTLLKLYFSKLAQINFFLTIKCTKVDIDKLAFLVYAVISSIRD